MASRTVMYAAAMGFGIARTMASALGQKARNTKIAPAAMPTLRAPTPVNSVTAMLVE